MDASFDLPPYLDRIGLEAAAFSADLDTLRRLHTAHVGTIPFENVDVQAGWGVRLDLASLQDKLIRRRRGGYCFEQNTLFMHALASLGFEAIACEARVRSAGTTTVLPRTHMVLVVRLDGRDWLCDVGFGGEGLLEPLPLDGTEAFQIDRSMRVIVEGRLRVLQWRQDREWSDCYAFEPEPRYPVDFEVANWWVSTHPSSVFRQRLTVQRTLRDARHILRQLTYTVYRAGRVDVREIAPGEVEPLLRDVFGLEISDQNSGQ